MVVVEIIKEGKVTNRAEFKDEAESSAWLKKHIAKGTFGPVSGYQTHIFVPSESVKSAKKLVKKLFSGYVVGFVTELVLFVIVYHYVVKPWLG